MYFGTRCRGQLTAGREMVGVHVPVDDVVQPEPHGRGRFEVALGLAHGINDRTSGMTAATEEIRRGDHRSVCRFWRRIMRGVLHGVAWRAQRSS